MRKTFGRHVYLTMLERGEKAEKTLEYLRDVFGHASVSITRRYIGIRRDEILSIYDNL
jgi:integrase